MKILFLLLSIISFSASAQPKWAEGRILVSPKAGLPAAKFTKIIKGHGAQVASGTGSALSATWNTNPKKVSTGQHVIKAVARDAAGNASAVEVVVTK